MSKLVLSHDGLVLDEVVLDGEQLSIGRECTSDIRIDNPAISRRHARITCILGDAFIEDLDSTNGTYVNGRAIRRHALRSEDLIELGPYRLKYVHDRSDVAQLGQDCRVQPTRAPATEAGEAVLEVCNGPGAGRRLVLAKAETKLGLAGKEAVAVVHSGNAYHLRRLTTDGMLTLNGAALDGEAMRLRHGDVIGIESSRIVFSIVPGLEQPA